MSSVLALAITFIPLIVCGLEDRIFLMMKDTQGNDCTRSVGASMHRLHVGESYTRGDMVGTLVVTMDDHFLFLEDDGGVLTLA